MVIKHAPVHRGKKLPFPAMLETISISLHTSACGHPEPRGTLTPPLARLRSPALPGMFPVGPWIAPGSAGFELLGKDDNPRIRAHRSWAPAGRERPLSASSSPGELIALSSQRVTSAQLSNQRLLL